MSIKKTVVTSLFALTFTVGGVWAQGQSPMGSSSPETMSGKTALQFFADNNIKAGVNVGNGMDATSGTGASRVAQEGAWGAGRTPRAFFEGARASGFDIVRIPVTWIGKIGAAPNYTLDANWIARADTLVNWAKEAGFKAIIINIHHDGNSGDPQTWGFLDLRAARANASRKTEIQDQLARVWTQIANYFRNYGDYLIFETMNEVHSGNWGCDNMTAACTGDQDVLFDWNQAALNAIRATGGNNATRFVAVPGLGSTEPYHVVHAHGRGKLIPNDGANGTNNMIVSVHFYDPWRYTVADITSQGEGDSLIHRWGTQAERDKVNSEIGSLRTTFINNGIAVYVGEWGAQTDVRSRSTFSQEVRNMHIDYISTVAGAITANGAVPIYWDDGGNFRMLNRSTGRATAGFHAEVHKAMIAAIEANPPPPVTSPDCTQGVDCPGDPCPDGQVGTRPNCTTETPPQGEYAGPKSPIAITPQSLWETVTDNDAGGASTITLAVNDGIAQVSYTLSKSEYEYDPYISAKLPNLDVSGCGWGIGYSYKGSAHALRTNQSDVEDYNYHFASAAASDDWKTVTVPWSAFGQASWGDIEVAADRTKVTAIEWFVIGADGLSDSFEVRDVYCLEDAEWTSSILRPGVNHRSVRPNISVRGRTLSVSLPNVDEALTIRMIDVRGRVRATYNVADGNARITLSRLRVPAGRYMVDVRGANVRQTVAVVVR